MSPIARREVRRPQSSKRRESRVQLSNLRGELSDEPLTALLSVPKMPNSEEVGKDVLPARQAFSAIVNQCRERFASEKSRAAQVVLIAA